DGLIAEMATEKRLRRRTKRDKVRQFITYTSAPGYLFIALRPGRPIPYDRLFRLHLVKSFVTIDGQPARLNHDAVTRFLKWHGADLPDYYRHFKTGAEFNVGDSVINARGVFQDHEMRVEDVRDGEAIFFLRML